MTSAEQTTLSREQEQAAGLLAEGKPVAEVAEEIATDVETVASWQASFCFVAEVNRQRRRPGHRRRIGSGRWCHGPWTPWSRPSRAETCGRLWRC